MRDSLTMAGGERLYERATPPDGLLDSLWHLDEAHTLFVGPLQYNGSHQHGAPVFLAGLHGAFGLRVRNGSWLTCRTAVIPAGVPHELNVGGNAIAVLYVEPSAAGVDILVPLVGGSRETDGVLVGSAGEIAPMRALYEDQASLPWLAPALGELLAFAKRRERRPIDARIAHALRVLRDRPDELADLTALAGEAGLSASRFQHLFTETVGVPFRRYRSWARMRSAIGEIVRGSNFTNAAHDAGFSDQAHFAHDFRRTFGAPASISLSNVRRPV